MTFKFSFLTGRFLVYGGSRTTNNPRMLNTLYMMNLQQNPLTWRKLVGDGKNILAMFSSNIQQPFSSER